MDVNYYYFKMRIIMGKNITVTPEELVSASKKLQQHSQNYTDIYKQLLQKVNSMADAWQGEDNLKFVDKINGLTNDLQSIANKLTNASEILLKQSENYTQRQQANINAINKLQN